MKVARSPTDMGRVGAKLRHQAVARVVGGGCRAAGGSAMPCGLGVARRQGERRGGILAAGDAPGRGRILVNLVGAVVRDPMSLTFAGPPDGLMSPNGAERSRTTTTPNPKRERGKQPSSLTSGECSRRQSPQRIGVDQPKRRVCEHLINNPMVRSAGPSRREIRLRRARCQPSD